MRFIPHWRKATWVIVLWTVLMALWIVSTSGGTNSILCPGTTCTPDKPMNKIAAVIVIFLIWFVGFVVLSLIWLMSRREKRLCPVCGEQVKKGLTACPKCHHDFAAAAAGAGGASAP
jgi:hypothetical protein